MNIKNLINYKKIISVITATSLLVSFVIGPTAASAINNEQTVKEYNQIFKEFVLPYSYGKITKSHFAGTDRVIINIQDLHCHPQVQKNISNIIQAFDKKFGVNKIYLEGAYGDVSTKWILAKSDNNKNIIEKMLDTGRLTGAEYYSALSGRTELIKGLEEKEPYLDNIKRLGQILQNQEKIDLILKTLNDSVEKVKKTYYTKRQYKIEDLFRQYKTGKITSQKYYMLLSKHIDKLGIDLTKYENTLIYITLLELQKKLNYKQITRDLQELISLLKQQLPYSVYKSLLENTENFKEIEKLYSYIVQLDKNFNLNISLNFKELDKYFRYVELSKKINPVELVKEDEFLVQEINTRFSQTRAQQEVVFLTYFEKYLTDYLTTKITPDDYEYYKNNIEKYRKTYNKYVDNRVLSLLDEYIAETDKFYYINVDRNTYFTKNIFKENELLNKIENPQQAKDDINKIIDNMQKVKKLDIVVTGGFHSQTVTDLLEKQNVSYIVITPNVTDGIKLAEDTYYELAREQSKILFQTIAPVIASLSPQLQRILLEKAGETQEEKIDRIISLDDTERTKLISELIAAKLLESDDLGKIQDVIKDIVDDLHKEKVTPELVSQIKNLQDIIKDTEKLQKIIDLLSEGTTKQSLILIRDMFAKLYTVFDSFVSFANKTLAQQEKISSIKYIENIQTGKNSQIYYDEAEEKQEEISDNISRFFNLAGKNKLNLISVLSDFFADTFEIKEETVNINKSNSFFYPTSTISFVVRDNKTHKEYKISIESFLNVTTMDFSMEIEGDSDREKYTPLLDTLAQNIMNGDLKIESKEEIKLKPEAKEKNRKIYYDEAEGKQEEISDNINRFFNRAETNELKIIPLLNEIFADTFEIKEETVNINKNNTPFYPTSTISFVVRDNKTHKEYKISIVSFLNVTAMDFSIEIEGDSDREKYTPLLDKLAQEILNGNFKIENKKEIKKEQIGERRKSYYDEGKEKSDKIHKNIRSFFKQVKSKKAEIQEITNKINILFGDNFIVKEGRLIIDNNMYYPTDTINLVIIDKKTKKEYEISIVDFDNLGYMDFSIGIKGDSDREKYTPLLDKLAQEIMNGSFNFELEEEVKPESEGKSRKIYYDEAEEKQEEISKNINGFFNRAETNELKIMPLLNGIFADTFEIKEETIDINKGNNPFYPTSTISFVVRDNKTHKEYKILMVSFLNVTAMDFSIEIEGYSDREKYTPLLDKLAQEIMNGSFNFELEEEVKSESEGKTRKIYYDEAEEKQEETSKNINRFFNRAEKNESNLISGLSEFFADKFEIKEETIDINKDNNPFYPTSIISFVVRDNKSHKEYKISIVSFLNVTAMDFSIEIEGDSDREKYTPLLDKLAQEIMNGNFKIDDITSKNEKQNKASKDNIKQLKREIIKAGKNNKDIVDFVSYLTRHDMSDYELLNRILVELKKLEDWEIPGYCGIIYALTNKDNRKNDEEKALKTKENIMSFFEKSKLLQLKFCDLFSNFFKEYNDYINEDFFGALLDYVNKNKYDEQDFDLLFEICEYSRFIAELGTKENMYAFLSLNMEKRIQIYEFYISSRDNFDIDINRLTLNFILSVAQKYNLSQDRFNYLMKLICMSNLMNTDIEKIYVDGLKEKDINMFVLDKIKNINVYNKYLLDLLFSDVDGKYIKNFDSKLQRTINLFDELKKYEIVNLETENKALALVVFLSDDFEKYCKDNNIKDIVKQYQLAIRVTRRIYSLSGNNIFDISQTQMEKIIDATLLYYKKLDEIISLINAFTNKTAVFSLYNSERSFDGVQRFTPTGLKEIFNILGINPEVCNFIEISFIDTIMNFINSMDGQDLNKKEILDFIDNLEGSIIVKETMKKHINSIKGNTISKKNIIRYIERTKEQQIENEIENFLGMLENFNKYGHKKGTFLFDGHGVTDGFFYSKNGKITIERLIKALITAHNNGVNLENITLIFSCCNSYDFAGMIVTNLINNGITVYPQIITDAGKETVYAYDKNIETSFGQTRVSNLFYSLIMFLKSKNPEEIKQMKGKLTFKEIADVPRYLSNNTIFMANKQISELNQELDKNIRQIIEEFDSEDEERFYPVMEDGKYVGAYNPYAELQLPSTQKMLEKIGNLKIIKRLYKAKSGEEFRFTKFGVAIGVLFETFLLWLPNFVKKHNFSPGDEARMTAVVWVIRALSIGIGLATGSVFVVFLTETITHYVWNRLAILSEKKKLLLQTSENFTKEQMIQKIFEESNMETDFEEADEERQELNSLLNKEQIFETDMEFVLQRKDFFENDSLYNYYRLKFFFSVINLLRENNIDIDNEIYEQIMFLMTIFTYEISSVYEETKYKMVEQLDEEGNTKETILRFFNLKNESKQQIYEQLKGKETLVAFDLMLSTVEKCEQADCSNQEIEDLLTLIKANRDVMEKYYFKDLKNKIINANFLRFYSQEKHKAGWLKFLFFRSPLWLSLVYGNVNIKSLIGNDERKFDNLSELMKFLNIMKIRMLDTEYGGLTLKIFLNDKFRKTVAKQYKMEGKEFSLQEKQAKILNMYRIAQKIARTLYETIADNLSMLTEQDLNAIMETLVRDNANRRAIARQTDIVSENIGVIAIHNIEVKDGKRRFTLKGIRKVFELLNISPKLETDFVIENNDDIKNKSDKWLNSIENFLNILEQNGLTNIRYVFDGHGTSSGLYLVGDGIESIDAIIDGSGIISVKSVAEALFKAYKKCYDQGKGEKFESLILDLSSCGSYGFARNVISELKQMEDTAGLPLRFPQIITEAGKETKVGFSTTYEGEEDFILSNMEEALVHYILESSLKGKLLNSISLQDLFDAQIFMSNHTIFVSNQKIEVLNEKLKGNIKKILGEDFIPEEGEFKETDVLIDIDSDYNDRLPSVVTELQLPSTQKMLEKIGDLKIIKRLYKEKAGENFRFTKLGIAIGTIIELFSFWSPNFIKAHNFDPSIQARMTAVVWVIRALSIGLGLGTGIALTTLFGPLTFLFGIPALFLTETIGHFIWNIKSPSNLLLQTPSQQSKEIVTEYTKNDYVTVLLITKEDGTQYSVRFALTRITDDDKVKQDYIRTGVLDRKMFVYLSSVNDDAFSMATSKYTTLEYIERITGVKVEVSKNTIVARSTDPTTQVTFVRNKDIHQTISSLTSEQLPLIEEQEQADVEKIAQSEVTETIYLDDSQQEIEKKFKQAIENNSLIVIYPFSNTYDIDSLTDEQLYSLYFDIQSKFLDLQEMLDEYLPQIDDRRSMAYILKEFIKNAFVHGNLSDTSKPIYIKFIKNGFTVINEEETVENEKIKLKRLNLSAAATLTGAHKGLQIIRDYEEAGLIKLEQEIKTKEIITVDGKKKQVSYYIVSAVRTSEDYDAKTKINFNSLIGRVFKIIDLIEKTNGKYPGDRAKSMTEAEEILTQSFGPEELEIIDLLASAIFDSIKYVNSTRNTSAVEFVNIIYSLQNGLFNDNFLMYEGDLKQHILNMLKHYVEVSIQKKGAENILVKSVRDNERLLDDMADFLTEIIIKNNLIEKSKKQREQRMQNISKFIEGVQKDDTAYSAIMICSANENRSAIWHIMFEDFLKRTKRTMTKVFSAGVFYDISQEVIRQTGKARVLRDDYQDTLTFDERYKGIDESIKSSFRSTYIKYLKIPKGSQPVFIVAGEQHRAQLIKLGYDPNWIFLMSEFYSDEFKTDFKQTHESLGNELEENNIFSMSEYPDPFEEQILRQDLPELTKSLIEYVFKTRDDIIREKLPEKFVKFTDDYNQFEHMENLPSFAFTDDEKREATRELYGDEVADLVREKYQFEFMANTKYLYILQNRNNKDSLLEVVTREDAELKFKLFALMYLIRMRRGLTQEEMNLIDVAKDKMLTELKKQLENNSFNILNNFDLRSYMMGIYLMLQSDSLKKPVPEIIYNAFIINKSDRILANSDGYFAEVDLFTVVHELTHVVVLKPEFLSRLVTDTVDEMVSYITPNMFLSIVKLSLNAYSKVQNGYTLHQTNGLIDYVKMGKKLHVLYNLFSEQTSDFDLRQEEHSAPIAFLELLFNTHRKIGKNIDWLELFETIKTMKDEHFDQSSMFWTILIEYTEKLVEKGTFSKQEADNLIKEMEKMQLWTLLTYDIVQNIKISDPETYKKIIENKSSVSFEEQILANPTKTKEYFEKISGIIKSKESLSRNDILILLIMDVIAGVDYEQLINNFDGVIEGIMNAVRISAQMFDMQKGKYSLSEYEQILKYVTDNYNITQESTISIMGNIFDFIANSLDQLFFAKLLINRIFGTKDLSVVLNNKKLLIVTSKQQEEILQQVLKNNNVKDIKIVTMEIRTEPVNDIRSDIVLDVQKGIKSRYNAKENQLIVYSKKGINITAEEIQSLIMQEYFAERNEDIVAEDVIAFADVNDTTFDDITNRLKTAYTASVTMPNKETKFDLSSRKIANFITVCNQEFKATGIKTFVVTHEQSKQFADEIKLLKGQDYRFVISCKSDNVADITDYDGLVIDATAIMNLDHAINFMESIKKKVLTQGVAKQVSVKFKDDIYTKFEYLDIDIFNKFGIIPVMNADRIRNVGKYEVEKVTENNIDMLLRDNNVIGLVIDNAKVFVGKKGIIKQLFSKEHKYNKGYNASLSSKFDYICYDVSALAEFLSVDINNEKDFNKLKNIDLSKLSLSSDALTYLEYLQKKGNYEEMAGFIRGVAMNTARVQIISSLKEKGIELDMDKFAKEAGGKYQKTFLTVAVQLMIEGIDITKLLETDFIDSNITTKQYLDSIYEKVNINIDDILKQNEYKIQRLENTAKTIENFKNYVVLLDNLKIVKETTVNFDMSIKAVRNMLAAA